MFKNLKIKTSIIIIIIFSIFFTLAIGYYGVSNLKNFNVETSFMTEKLMPGIGLILNADRDMYQVLVAMQDIGGCVPGSPEWNKCVKDIDENLAQVRERVNGYLKNAVTQKQRDLVNSHIKDREEWAKKTYDYVEKLKNAGVGDKESLLKSVSEIETSFSKARNVLNELTEIVEKMAVDKNEAMKVTYKISRTNTIIMIGANIFILLLILYFISGHISKTINDIITECQMLVKSIADGRLSNRGDAGKINFEFSGIIKGINGIMDAYNKPIELTVDYIDKISNGVLPETIKEEYRGDFNKIKAGFNNLIAVLNDFSGQMKNIYRDHQNGEIDVKLDLEKFNGIYKEIGESVSKTVSYHIDAILKILSIIEDYGVKGDFSRNLERFPGKQIIANQMIDGLKNNLQSVIAETKTLARSGIEGLLKTRGDENKFVGDYREIVAGINKTLDAVIKPVEEASACLAEMARGNLDVYMKGDYRGDHAIIKESLNKTIDSMNETLAQVTIAVDQVDTGSRQVSDASQSLSQSATESASAIEEITATMQEISSQTRQNADNAGSANKLSADARNSAEEGNDKMHAMKKAMAEINEASANVAKIIKAIDEIAFQTNLLALNAAVEAARAGKHGKGFTVVAEEVRNLAQRSAKAAKETAEMIESSIKKAEAGAKIAQDTAQSLETIVSGSAKVTDLIGEIAAAAHEQEKSVTQVNQGLAQIDNVTQQNTATAEEAAAASEELSSQAAELKGMLARFNLRKSGAAVKAYVKKTF
ncbi:MAG TPA: methyl-accepting chemotaxis protein [Candidatus Wallbacteria bacterium]|nr:MAG: Methyl-accepting chemotaxis protein II [bacterium ADurb.Bin243]HPG56275.1 methyl-accepting chemotaxis protein [Candidatus Wallbacteria bacterium]